MTDNGATLKKKPTNQTMKKNQIPLFWIISSIYTMVKETNTRILFWRK